MRLLPVFAVLLLLPGCGGDPCDPDHKDFVDADEDGVCDELDACEGSDDGADADGDGVPDGCDSVRLAGFRLEDVDLNAPTDSLNVVLAYDASGSQASWTKLDPGWDFTSDALDAPIGFDTQRISGWGSFEEALTDGTNDELAVLLQGPDGSGARSIQRGREDELRLGQPDLAGATVLRIEVVVDRWRTDETKSRVSVGVDFYGR